MYETYSVAMTQAIECILTVICLHTNRKAHMVCKLEYIVENQVHLSVTCSYIQYRSGNISVMVQVTLYCRQLTFCFLSISSNSDDF